VREAEARRGANSFVSSEHLQGPLLKNFRDAFMFCGADIKAVFEELKTSTSPDLVLTHFRKMMHIRIID